MADLSLAALGVLHPLFIACREVIRGYKLTQNFGNDYDKAKRMLEIQCAWFEQISQRSIRFIQSQDAVDPFDENNRTTNAIVSQIALMKVAFNEIDDLIKKNEQNASSRSHSSSFSGISGPGHSPTSRSSIAGGHAETLRTVSPGAGSVRKVSDQVSDGGSMVSSAKTSSWRWSMKPLLSRIDSNKTEKSRPKKERRVYTLPDDSPLAITGPSIVVDENSVEAPLRSAGLLVQRSYSQRSKQVAVYTGTGNATMDIMVNDMERLQIEQSKHYQSSTPIYRRIQWAKSDQDMFFEKLAEIRNGNQTLEHLLPYRAPEMSTVLPKEEGPFSELKEVQGAFERLHSALAQANGRVKKEAVEISIKIDEDVVEKTKEICRQEDIFENTNSNQSFVFILRGHGCQDDSEAAVEFLARTDTKFNSFELSEVEQETLAEEDRIKSLKKALSRPFLNPYEIEDDEMYQQIGYACRSKAPQIQDAHRLYRNELDKWKATHTLESLLSIDDLKKKVSAIQQLQFSKLIVRGQLNLANIRHECADPRPPKILFYTALEDEEDEDENKPPFIGPYFNIGFGSKPPRVRLGASSGSSAQRSNIINELGVLLFQIGACKTLDYGNGMEGFRKAKMDALTQIHELDYILGAAFAELVQVCLMWDNTKNPTNRIDAKEIEIMKGLILKLKQLEEYVNNEPDLSYLLR